MMADLLSQLDMLANWSSQLAQAKHGGTDAF